MGSGVVQGELWGRGEPERRRGETEHKRRETSGVCGLVRVKSVDGKNKALAAPVSIAIRVHGTLSRLDCTDRGAVFQRRTPQNVAGPMPSFNDMRSLSLIIRGVRCPAAGASV